MGELKLHGEELLLHMEAVEKYCNGVGAEWFPSWLRWAVGALHPTMILPSKIHDLRYEYGGSFWSKIRADVEFFANCVKSAWAKYGLDQLRLYVVLAQSAWYFVILLAGGWTAWNFNGKNDDAL